MPTRGVFLSAALLLAVFALSACGKSKEAGSKSSTSLASSSQSSAVTSGNLAEGKRLYDGGLCSGCHGLKGSGAASTGGNVINMARLQATTASFSALAAYIEAEMPFDSPQGCNAACAADTATYLLSWLSSSSSSRSSSSQSSVASALNGADLYQSLCVSCHGERGDGTYKIIADNWAQADLETKITNTMPAGNPSECNAECAAAIAQTILSWQSGVSCDVPEQLLPRRLRLLTPREYQLTINDLFNLRSWNTLASNLPITESIRGYDNNVPEIKVSDAHVSQYWATAEVLSETVNVNSLVNCNNLDQNQCAQQWVGDMAPRVFRRPLSTAEHQDYVDLFNSADDAELGKRLTLKSLLMSPNFIYRSEMGTAQQDGSYQLDPYEVASLLSYTFWGTTPDETLITAAANNALSSATQIRQQVERLLSNNRAKKQLIHFAKQWLETTSMRYITKDPIQFPEFSSSVSVAMDDEQEAFFSEVFLSQNHQFADLFLADFVYVNKILADFYGISGVTSPDLKATPANAQRGGILNLGAVLVAHAKMDQTSPISRGVFVRERLLCQEFPAPPPNAGTVVPLNPELTTRERFSAHTDNDGCRSCHEKIDPIGFTFERYDGSGHYRTYEGEVPVDDSGSLTGLRRMSDTDYWPYAGTKGLSNILAESGHAASCLADQYQTFVQGVAKADRCGVYDLVSRWKTKSYNLYDLWMETALSPSFIRRQQEAAQ